MPKESKPEEPVNPPPPVEKHHGLETKTIVLIVGGVVTVIAGGTAGYFGLKARSAGNDAERLLGDAQSQFGPHKCSNPAAAGSNVCAQIQAKLDDHDAGSRVYNIMLPIAGAAAVATGLMYAFWPSRKDQTSQHLTLVPLADQRTGGVLVQGNF